MYLIVTVFSIQFSLSCRASMDSIFFYLIKQKLKESLHGGKNLLNVQRSPHLGSTDLNIDRLVTLVSHDRSRSQNAALMLKPAYCKPLLFRPFFNRIVKPWNSICRLATSDKFSSLSIFKDYLRATYFSLLDNTFDIDMPCTCFPSRNFACHRS